MEAGVLIKTSARGGGLVQRGGECMRYTASLSGCTRRLHVRSVHYVHSQARMLEAC